MRPTLQLQTLDANEPRNVQNTGKQGVRMSVDQKQSSLSGNGSVRQGKKEMMWANKPEQQSPVLWVLSTELGPSCSDSRRVGSKCHSGQRGHRRKLTACGLQRRYHHPFKKEKNRPCYSGTSLTPTTRLPCYHKLAMMLTARPLLIQLDINNLIKHQHQTTSL